jgi:hypothetical protein
MSLYQILDHPTFFFVCGPSILLYFNSAFKFFYLPILTNDKLLGKSQREVFKVEAKIRSFGFLEASFVNKTSSSPLVRCRYRC